MYDIAGFGELLIDFMPAGLSKDGKNLFECNAGGAPANVLSAATMLGGSGVFIGKVGNDYFGRFLKSEIEKVGICSRGLLLTEEYNTALAFVSLDQQGNRSFSFYRKQSADLMIKWHEIDNYIIKNSKIIHTGSLTMTAEPARTTTLHLLDCAKKNKKIISYDPNWRPMLWDSVEEGRRAMRRLLSYADIVKISEEEMELLTGDKDIEQCCSRLINMGISIVFVTLGKKGCCCANSEGIRHLPTYDTKVVDTTGSGDAFMGAVLYHLSRLDSIRGTNLDTLCQIADYGNAAGALCATKYGAIASMPTMSEIYECIKHTPKLILSE